MKKVEDLITAARTVHDRYAAGRMERDIVRQWVIGLSSYPEPHGAHVQAAITWFRPSRDGTDPVEVKITDLAKLQAIYQS